MGSPISHFLLGLSLFLIVKFNRKITKKDIPLIGLFLFLSVLPDFDSFIFSNGRIIFDDMYHHGITHSISFSVVIAAVFVLTYYILERLKIVNFSKIFNFKKDKFSVLNIFLIVVLILSMHITLDYFTEDLDEPGTGNGKGLMLFFPFTENYYISNQPIIHGVEKTSIFNAKNANAIKEELLLFFPPFICIYILRIISRKHEKRA